MLVKTSNTNVLKTIATWFTIRFIFLCPTQLLFRTKNKTTLKKRYHIFGSAKLQKKIQLPNN